MTVQKQNKTDFLKTLRPIIRSDSDAEQKALELFLELFFEIKETNNKILQIVENSPSQTKPLSETWYTKSQVLKYLNISSRTFQALKATNKLEVNSCGTSKKLYVSGLALQKYLESGSNRSFLNNNK